jgi:hypothetical protein
MVVPPAFDIVADDDDSASVASSDLVVSSSIPVLMISWFIVMIAK